MCFGKYLRWKEHKFCNNKLLLPIVHQQKPQFYHLAHKIHKGINWNKNKEEMSSGDQWQDKPIMKKKSKKTK